MATDELTDPEDVALYNQYGPNWRRIIGSGMRDRGGRYDRNMRFNHGVPSGFLTRPTSPQSFMPQPAIDTGVYEKYRMEYDRLMAEYNSLMNQYYQSFNQDPYSDYERQQQYYENNWNDLYAQAQNQNSSQTNQYDPGQVVGGTITSSTGGQGLNLGGNTAQQSSFLIPQARTASFSADAGKAWRDSQASSAPTSYTGVPNVARAPAAPVQNMVRPEPISVVAPSSYTAPPAAYTAPAASTVLAPRGGDSLFGGYGSAKKSAPVKTVSSVKKVKGR